jgi:hypothetical protein
MSHWNTIVDVLRDEHGILFERGLSDGELEACEREFGIRFPPDLRAFLNCALPVSDRFPDWRNASRDDLRVWLELPVEGILFDVEHNGFWLPEWGERPADLPAANRRVRTLVARAPKLIPVYAHRMIPDRPHAEGNPIFSVHQTDIICYGCDLRDYLLREFCANPGVGVWPIPAASLRPIEFWDVERFATRWERGSQSFDAS